MKRMFIVVLFVSFVSQALAFNNPGQGRWMSRDPIGEPGFEAVRKRPLSLHRSGSNQYLFVRNSPVNEVDALGLCPCRCLRVVGGPAAEQVSGQFLPGVPPPGGGPNTLLLGVKVPWKVTVSGDPSKCRCRYIDDGVISGELNSTPFEAPFPHVIKDPIPCTYSEDQPGFELGVGPSGSLSYALRYQLSVTLVCEDEDGSGSVSDTVNIDALFMGGDLRWP